MLKAAYLFHKFRYFVVLNDKCIKRKAAVPGSNESFLLAEEGIELHLREHYPWKIIFLNMDVGERYIPGFRVVDMGRGHSGRVSLVAGRGSGVVPAVTASVLVSAARGRRRRRAAVAGHPTAGGAVAGRQGSLPSSQK